MSIFSKHKFSSAKTEEMPEAIPCPVGLCDGSGLREIDSLYGLRFVKCECKKLENSLEQK